MNVAEVNQQGSVSGTAGKELTALDAARRLGIELNRVYVLLRMGRLAGRKVDGEWRVSIQGIEKRLQQRQRGQACESQRKHIGFPKALQQRKTR